MAEKNLFHYKTNIAILEIIRILNHVIFIDIYFRVKSDLEREFTIQ